MWFERRRENRNNNIKRWKTYTLHNSFPQALNKTGTKWNLFKKERDYIYGYTIKRRKIIAKTLQGNRRGGSGERHQVHLYLWSIITPFTHLIQKNIEFCVLYEVCVVRSENWINSLNLPHGKIKEQDSEKRRIEENKKTDETELNKLKDDFLNNAQRQNMHNMREKYGNKTRICQGCMRKNVENIVWKEPFILLYVNVVGRFT